MDDEPVPIPITDILDLHSVPPRDVQPVVEAYLEEAHRLGFRALRIIHGKGIGIQRQTVHAVLSRNCYVISFGDAPADAGGWGATVVTLTGSEPSRPLPSSVQDTLKQDLLATIEEFRSLTAPLSEPEMLWRPSPTHWSVSECLEHLNQTNQLILAEVARAMDAARARGILGNGPFHFSWLDRWLLKTVGPQPGRKFKAPKAYLPTPRPPAETLARFETLHQQAAALIESSRGLDLVRVKVPSPVLRWLRLSLGIQFAVLNSHDRRHLLQAARVAQAVPTSL